MADRVKCGAFMMALLLAAAVSCFGQQQFPVLDTRPVSAPISDGVSAGGGSYGPVLSADGRWLFFVSHANNLIAGDNQSPHLDLFCRDLAARTNQLISREMSGTGGGNGDSGYPSASSNGQWIAFQSGASNLATNDTNNLNDIFLHDLAGGVTRLISAQITSGYTSPTGESVNPLISADGRYIAFESWAGNLVATPVSQGTNVFLCDTWSNQAVQVSISVAGQSPDRGPSLLAGISGDGQRVLFTSFGRNLTSPSLTTTNAEIYVRDLSNNLTICVSSNVTLATANYCLPMNPVISRDGRSVAYKVKDNRTDLYGRLFHYQIDSGMTTLLGTNTSVFTDPAISADGRYVASEDGTSLVVWDLQTGLQTNLNLRADSQVSTNDVSYAPVMNGDGTRVVFLSTSTDLVSGTANNKAQIYVRDWKLGSTWLASQNPVGQAALADHAMSAFSVSANGAVVALDSADPTLAPGDLNQQSDVFLFYPGTTGLELVSKRAESLPSSTAMALVACGDKAISADGRLVAFAATDGNLVAGDSNGISDIFVREMSSGSNRLMSLDWTDTNGVLGNVRSPVLSADGSRLAYLRAETRTNVGGERIVLRESTGGTTVWEFFSKSNFQGLAISSDGRLLAFSAAGQVLPWLPSQSVPQVYVYDSALNLTNVASVGTNGVTLGNKGSILPLFSPDSRWLAFLSMAGNLTPSTFSFTTFRLHLRDLAMQTNFVYNTRDGTNPVFSASNQFVSFTDPVNKSMVLRDLLNGTNAILAGSALTHSFSADGRWVAWQTNRPTASDRYQVFLRDRAVEQDRLITRSWDGATNGNGNSFNPLISGDGRYVIFSSRASNLAPIAPRLITGIYIYDTILSNLVAVPGSSGAGTPFVPVSINPMLAADGRTVVFDSYAPDVVPNDHNQNRDIFLIRLGGGDSDNDGMDDEWEMTYFGTLDRDGSGDFDRDGFADQAEFKAGTNPGNNNSVLRASSYTLNGSQTLLAWSTVPGRRYRVEYKESLNDQSWTPLADGIYASGTTETVRDTNIIPTVRRFYRIVLLP